MNKSTILICKNLCKHYQDGIHITNVLKNINLIINKKEMIVIIGSSGSGKSTLLHLLGGLDKPTSGYVIFNNHKIHSLSSNAKAKLRNHHLGFIYQFHHLLSDFTSLENVMIPLLIMGTLYNKAREQAYKILKTVGLLHRINHRSNELSGGERQRVAIARALVNKPILVLADEPTGNLDLFNTNIIFELLLEFNNIYETTFLIVTHDFHFANRFSNNLEMMDGILKKK